MSWSEVKKINGDMKKSLDTLIKEQFSSNNSNVSNVKNDVTYIKNTQLGTNLNNLLNGSSIQTIDFNNKPLVDKVNYLLLNTDTVEYSNSSSTMITSYVTETRTRGGIGSGIEYIKLIEHTFLQNGSVKISVDIKKDYYRSDDNSSGGISISKNSSSEKLPLIEIIGQSQMSYTTKMAILNVNKGDTITFYLKGASVGAFYCKNFKVFGQLLFINPYKI